MFCFCWSSLSAMLSKASLLIYLLDQPDSQALPLQRRTGICLLSRRESRSENWADPMMMNQYFQTKFNRLLWWKDTIHHVLYGVVLQSTSQQFHALASWWIKQESELIWTDHTIWYIKETTFIWIDMAEWPGSKSDNSYELVACCIKKQLFTFMTWIGLICHMNQWTISYELVVWEHMNLLDRANPPLDQVNPP